MTCSQRVTNVQPPPTHPPPHRRLRLSTTRLALYLAFSHSNSERRRKSPVAVLADERGDNSLPERLPIGAGLRAVALLCDRGGGTQPFLRLLDEGGRLPAGRRVRVRKCFIGACARVRASSLQPFWDLRWFRSSAIFLHRSGRPRRTVAERWPLRE